MAYRRFASYDADHFELEKPQFLRIDDHAISFYTRGRTSTDLFRKKSFGKEHTDANTRADVMLNRRVERSKGLSLSLTVTHLHQTQRGHNSIITDWFNNVT